MWTRRNNKKGMGGEQSSLSRLLWFGLGLSAALIYNQLTWRKLNPTPSVPVVKKQTEALNEQEQDEIDRVLQEMQEIRKDYKRMKLSRDMTKERLDKCEAKCPAAKQQDR